MSSALWAQNLNYQIVREVPFRLLNLRTTCILRPSLSINYFTGNVGCWYLISGDGSLRIIGGIRMRWQKLVTCCFQNLSPGALISDCKGREWILSEIGSWSLAMAEKVMVDKSCPSLLRSVPGPCWLMELPTLSFQGQAFPLENAVHLWLGLSRAPKFMTCIRHGVLMRNLALWFVLYQWLLLGLGDAAASSPLRRVQECQFTTLSFPQSRKLPFKTEHIRNYPTGEK